MKDYRLGETTWQFLIEKFDVIFYYCESLGTGLPLIDLIKMGAKPVEPDEREGFYETRWNNMKIVSDPAIPYGKAILKNDAGETLGVIYFNLEDSEPDEVELEELPVSHGLEPENADKHDIVYNRSSIIELQEKVNVIIQQLNSLKSRIKEVENVKV